MAPHPDDNVAMLSDSELLDTIEHLLTVPGFIDLDLGYDRASATFYAGAEGAGSLRELLRRVLRQNVTTALNLRELNVRSSSTPAPATVRPESSDNAQLCEGYRTFLPQS